MLDPADELVDVVDDDDRFVRVAPRAEMRARRLAHRATSVIVRRSSGEIYVHRRTPTKDVSAGMYDMFAGGVVGSGESYDGCALRELEEELGVAGVPLRYLGKHYYRGPVSRSWTAVYEATWDGPISPQLEEVAWGEFVNPEELDRMLAELEFCPDSREIFELLRGDRLGP